MTSISISSPPLEPPRQQKKAEQELALARIYCWLIAFLHPTWSVLIDWFLPDEYNDLVGRSIIGVTFLALGVLSYVSAGTRRNLARINNVGYSLFAIHWFWIVHQANMSTIYIIGSLVVAFAFNLGFTSLRSLAVYSGTLLVSSVATVVFTDAPLSNKFMLIMGILTSQVVGMSFIYTRTVIADHLEAAETRALRLQQQLVEKELEAAQVVQKNLLAASPDIPGVQISTFYQAAAQTGGDWYGNYYDEKQNYLYLWIGDVTGHGIPSALVTGVVCGALYSGESRMDYHNHPASNDERLLAAAHVVNRIIHKNGGQLLMTMLFMGIDLNTGKLTFTNAGHRFPMIVSSNNKVTQLTSSGSILGIDPGAKFSLKRAVLSPGDTLFMYTDGLVENAGLDSSTLNRPMLRELLSQVQDGADAIRTLSAATAKIWAGTKIEDDVTMMALTWHANPDRKSA